MPVAVLSCSLVEDLCNNTCAVGFSTQNCQNAIFNLPLCYYLEKPGRALFWSPFIFFFYCVTFDFSQKWIHLPELSSSLPYINSICLEIQKLSKKQANKKEMNTSKCSAIQNTPSWANIGTCFALSWYLQISLTKKPPSTLLSPLSHCVYLFYHGVHCSTKFFLICSSCHHVPQPQAVLSHLFKEKVILF